MDAIKVGIEDFIVLRPGYKGESTVELISFTSKPLSELEAVEGKGSALFVQAYDS